MEINRPFLTVSDVQFAACSSVAEKNKRRSGKKKKKSVAIPGERYRMLLGTFTSFQYLKKTKAKQNKTRMSVQTRVPTKNNFYRNETQKA